MNAARRETLFGVPLYGQHPAALLGRILLPLLPSEYISRCKNTMLLPAGQCSWLERIVKLGLHHRSYALDAKSVEPFSGKALWAGSSGKEWHHFKAEEYKRTGEPEEYIRFRKQLVEGIKQLACLQEFEELWEIGTGNGILLHHLEKELPEIPSFVGIDINAEQIETNRAGSTSLGTSFIHADAQEYIRDKCPHKVLFVLYGTLEYFTKEEIVALLETIASCGSSCGIAFAEPVNTTNQKVTESRPRGYLAYSHDYQKLLRDAGYLCHFEKSNSLSASDSNYQMLVISALAPPRALLAKNGEAA
jgi:hypothetical protein